MTREEWLVLFLGLPGGIFPVDQIRVMKGMFLWSQEGPRELRGLYTFWPYLYGPFTSNIYGDLERLEASGLVEVERSRGGNRRLYWLTGAGERKFAALEAALDDATRENLTALKRKVTSQGFQGLLEAICRDYPAYAINGVALEAAEAAIATMAGDEALRREVAEARAEIEAGDVVPWSALKRGQAPRRPVGA